MTVKEYNEADRDVEILCLANHRRRQQEDARMVAAAYMDATYEVCSDVMEHRRNQLKRVLFTCARIAPGMVFLGAVPREWMDPAFAVVCALGCFISAVGYYRRGYRYGQ